MKAYRWWTVKRWRSVDHYGWKLGPVSVGRFYYADGWYFSVFVCNRWTLWDGVLRAMQR